MKKYLSLFLAVVLLSLCGCSGVFSHSYHSETPFRGSQELDLNSNVQVVQNYSQLRRIVFNMMNHHEESAELLFSGYTGNVVSDITAVCNALKSESAYGAYCVEYGSYDLTQIVSYYEATIHISYLYTKEELADMLTTTNMDTFADLLAEQLQQEQEHFVVKVNNGSGEQDAVNVFVGGTLRSHPMAVSYTPKINVKIYNGNSSQRIYEVSVQYDEAVDNVGRLSEMDAEIERAVQGLEGKQTAEMVLTAAEYLSNRCSYSVASGNLAYDAFMGGSADSEGIACAMQALCNRLGVECMVVAGREDRLDHYWNIVKIEDAYYHMDVSTVGSLGMENSLFLRDEDKRIGYWWDQSAYPYCEAALTYTDINF